ncbi:MAG TPA: hypothetical protein PLW35_00985 [Verrucomicrobiota bacterium]|nr:hypothetical protein [Verrucomicrobiota bacterium]
MATAWLGPLHLTPVKVQCYAGFKGEEEPRLFILDQRVIEIEEILDRWYQVESKPEWPRANYFRVRGCDQCIYMLKHDLESDEWYLGSR